MKETVEKRKPSGIVDHIALALTTFGVGYIPGAPGTYGSIVAVAIYLIIGWVETPAPPSAVGTGSILGLLILIALTFYGVVNAIALAALTIAGIWASGRSVPMLGSKDPSEAVVDEVIGQLITFCFIPFGLGWPFILAGFLLFRLFDIWKPYPINNLQNLPGGLGVCADDIVAGVYAGICLVVGYAILLAI